MPIPVLEIIPVISKVLDRILPDKKAREQAKLALLELQQQGNLDDLKIRGEIVTSEIKGESWIQRAWRPILMLSIVAIVVNNYILYPYLNLMFGPDTAVILDLPDKMWNLMTVGVGGYIVGRSGEKIMRNIKNGSVS